MLESTVYRPHEEAEASATLRTLEASSVFAGVDARAFEYVSRGDFVEGRIYLPQTSQSLPAALVIVVHAAGESASSRSLDFTADWVRQGFAVAAIDLPLHGRRSSPKLSERLFQGLGKLAQGEEIDPDTHALVEEFARQATSDLIRGIDALQALPCVDGRRIGLLGLGVGSALCAYVLAHDERPRACVLAGGATRFEDAKLDPAATLTTRQPARTCPVLIQTLAKDSNDSLEAARAFFEAIPEPKEYAEMPGDAWGSGDTANAAERHAGDFLNKHLSA